MRLIVERERERMAFVSATYWDLLGSFAKTRRRTFEAALVSVDGRKIPAAKDFDPATGKLKDADVAAAGRARRRPSWPSELRQASFRVATLEDKPYTTKPYPPFTTSTLQQEANRKLGFTARRTMQVAQSLYENGHITYMRTDSTNLATVAVEAARELVASQYGNEYLPEQPRIYRTKVKNAQEAHEAIRPAGHPFDLPDALRSELDRRRVPAVRPDLEADRRQPDGRRPRPRHHDHHGRRRRRLPGQRQDDRFSRLPAGLRRRLRRSRRRNWPTRKRCCPTSRWAKRCTCRDLEPKSHTTQPPSRFSEAALTRALEEMGIGRPSTYASIIDTILARDYVFKTRQRAGADLGRRSPSSQLLETHLPTLVDYSSPPRWKTIWTPSAAARAQLVDYLRGFYFGNGRRRASSSN